MSRLIRNVDPVGSDCCLTPVMLTVPVVIVDYPGSDCLWYSEVMDVSAADRMVYAMMRSLDAEAYRVDVKIVLPSASDVRSATADLDQLSSEPARVRLRID